MVVCVGRARDPFADDVAHYERLLSRQARIESVELREAGGDQARRAQVLAREAEQIAARIPAGACLCALDRQGSALSSTELAGWLERRRGEGRDLCFVVGGPFGLDRSVIERAHSTLSFGPVTLPHQLARVVLLEQLFRAHKILAREPYHY